MFYALGGSKTLVKRNFFIMILRWHIQNIGRHQKKQTTRCTKPAQAPKNQKKTKFPATTQKWAHSSWKFWFFWCLSMFPQLSLCFFCVFLVPVQVWWLWLHKTLTGIKKNKKTKPLDAPNLHRHQKNTKKQNFQQLPRSGPIVPGNFVFFVFFGACRCFLNFHFVFFGFFGACQCFGNIELTSLLGQAFRIVRNDFEYNVRT